MEDEPKKYDPSNPQELTRDLYKKFRFETLVSLAQGKSVVVPKNITEGSLPFKDEPTTPELSLPLRDGVKTEKPENLSPRADPQMDLNQGFSQPQNSGPEPPISEDDRRRPFNPCSALAPPNPFRK